MSSPRDFECPTCDACAGSPCKRPSGHRVFGGGFHVARECRAEATDRIAREPWPDGWPSVWRASVELRMHQPKKGRPCGEPVGKDTFTADWWHPAWTPPTRISPGAECPRCGREIWLNDTVPTAPAAISAASLAAGSAAAPEPAIPAGPEAQPTLFEEAL